MALGFLMGEYPALNLQWILLFLLIYFVFRVNLSAFTFTLIIFKFIPPFLDPLAHKTGIYILSLPGLHNLFTNLYNNPYWYLTKFYNSVVMGYTILFLPLLAIFYFISKWLVNIYRNKWKEKIVNTKIYKGFVKLPLIAKIIKTGSSIKLR